MGRLFRLTGTTSSDDEEGSVPAPPDRGVGKRTIKQPATREPAPLPAKKKAVPPKDNTGGDKTRSLAPSVTEIEDESVEQSRAKETLPRSSLSIMQAVASPLEVPSAPVSNSPGDDSDDELIRQPRRAKTAAAIVIDDDDDDGPVQAAPAKGTSVGTAPKRKSNAISDDEADQDTASKPAKKKKKEYKAKQKQVQKAKKKAKTATLSDPTATDKDGMLIDLSNIDVEDVAESKSDKTRDIRAHFTPKRIEIKNGKKREVRDCLICKERGGSATKVDSHSTLRRHMASQHMATYRNWCKKNNFVSMLECDINGRKNAGKVPTVLAQGSLDGHLVEKEKIVPYSDAAFMEAALEWLVATDQPISALQHPKFREMIAVAARAKDGVKIPSGYETRKAILKVFQAHLRDLKERLNSSRVKGKISTTCDAWTSDPGDSYFAVTGHWIEQSSGGLWELHSALLGFTHVPYAHHGQRLGQALFKILDRLGISEKLGWVTCDNASNMNSMMREVASQMASRGVSDFDGQARRIRCLAHVINLATKALITAYGDTKNRPLATRNEVDIVREVAVKEKSSSQRRQVFIDIQTAAGVEHPLHLIKDMPVRWSSTKNMVERAYDCREHMAQLVREMVRAEKDRKKKDALNELFISDDEWEHLKLFLELLELPDCAQQAFSAEKYSTLYNAIPALLSLCHAWEARSSNIRYLELWKVLEPAISKLKDYITDLQDSPNDAYHLAMVLHPDIRLGPDFEACWPDAERRKQRTEDLFKARYAALNSQRKASAAAAMPKKGSLRTLMAEFRPATQPSPTTSESVSEEWRVEYESYIRSDHDLPESMSLVQWWGMMSTRYPTWASLAGDVLAAMASSVSSERVFSSAGITITKRRNRLQGDIVEATQVLKTAIREDLLVRPVQPSSTLEEILAEEEEAEATAAAENGAANAAGADKRAEKLDKMALEFSILLDYVSEDESSDDDL